MHRKKWAEQNKLTANENFIEKKEKTKLRHVQFRLAHIEQPTNFCYNKNKDDDDGRPHSIRN